MECQKGNFTHLEHEPTNLPDVRDMILTSTIYPIELVTSCNSFILLPALVAASPKVLQCPLGSLVACQRSLRQVHLYTAVTCQDGRLNSSHNTEATWN